MSIESAGGFAAVKDPRADEAMRRWDELKSLRAMYEADWNDIARLIRPQRGGFGLSDHTQRTLDKPLSSEPIIAASSMAAGIYGALTNPANRWGGLETPDQERNKSGPGAAWLETATRRCLASFSAGISSFYPATLQTYSDCSCFGSAAGYDELDQDERRFVDVTLSLAEVVFDIDHHGQVVEVVRRFHLTPRKARAMFVKGGVLPPKIIEMEAAGQTDNLTFYHHVLRNYGWEKGRLGVRGKRWLSRYATEVEHTLIREAGYDEMPFYGPRWDVDSGMIWGTGPGFIALPASRVLHQMEAATIRAAQRASDPTLLAPDRDAWPISGKATVGGVIYGGVSPSGQQMVTALGTTGQVGITIEMKRAKIEEIAKAFHYAVMPLSGRTGMTAEETRIVEEANLRNWAPNADRIMAEYAARKFERRFRLLWAAGQLPPPPKELEGLPLQVRYQSAAQMALRAREGQAVRQFLNDLAPLMQLGQDNLERVAARVDTDAALEVLHEASPSLPASLLRPREAADQMAEAGAQNRQLMAAAQLAPGIAAAARDGASAAAILGGGAQPQGGGR